MRWVCKPILALLLCAALSACGRPEEPLLREQLYTFGTLVELSIWDEDRARAERAAAEVAKAFDRMHAAWHPTGAGELGRLNRQLAEGEPAELPASLAPLLDQAAALERASGGLFNPAIGKLVRLWGFSEDQQPSAPPPAPAIAALVGQAPSMADLQIEAGRVRSANPAVQLDFGAYAKGYGVDRAIELLRAAGVQNAIVNAGGDLRAIGRRGERPWRIGIRDPRGPGILASVEVAGDESVFTSGDYERYYDYQGRRYHHIIDPRSGYPAQGVTSVTVIHGEAAVADAAATALFVAGVAGWRATAQDMGIDQVMLIDAQGRAHLSPAMAARVHFEGEPPVIVSEAQ